VIHPLAVGTAAQAGSQLRLLTIISLNTNNPAVPDMGTQNAAPSAIMTATGTDNGNVAIFRRLLSLYHKLSLSYGLLLAGKSTNKVIISGSIVQAF
jgi:hypothetical protein